MPKATKKAAKKQPAKKRSKEIRVPGGNGDIVESQSSAATRIGCPIEHVRLAKTMGAPAFFPGNRINVPKLTEFLQTPEFIEAMTAKATDENWDKRLKRAKALREENRMRAERSKLWDAEQVKMLYGAGDSAMIEVLRRYLENEQPPLVAGKSAGEVLKINRKFYDSLVEDLRDSRVEAVQKMGAAMPDDDDEESDI